MKNLAKCFAEKQTNTLVHCEVPVSLAVHEPCKLSHSQSGAVTSSPKTLSPPSPSGLSGECTACRLIQTVISGESAKHIAWLIHHNLDGQCKILLPSAAGWIRETERGGEGGRSLQAHDWLD